MTTFFNVHIFLLNLQRAWIRPKDNQAFNCTPFYLEALTVHGNKLRLFWTKAFPILQLLKWCCWHCSSRNFVTSLIITRDSNLTPKQQLANAIRVMPQSRVYILTFADFQNKSSINIFLFLAAACINFRRINCANFASSRRFWSSGRSRRSAQIRWNTRNIVAWNSIPGSWRSFAILKYWQND